MIRTLTRAVGLCIVAGCMLIPGVAAAAPSSATILLTNADNGVTRTVIPGETVVVELTGSKSTGTEWLWSLPVVSNKAVLGLDSEAQSGVVTTAVYTAKGFGTSSITSIDACRITAPGHACPAYVLLWQANVDVLLPPTA